jgi:Arc/MetJ-type ribon-helix-helix transcriptional regulator
MCYHTSQWYNMVQYNGKKINTSMNLDEDLLKWIDTQIAKKRFAHRTHAVEYVLQKLKEESK